jgi:putative tricarboxylic transport membrane protein
LKVFIPANPGGGWDQTGRALGGALVAAGLVEKVSYENLGGKAGTLGLPQFVERYKGDPNALMVGGMVMLGGIAMHRPVVDLSRVAPLAQLTSDYLVVVVPASSALKTPKDLLALLRDPSAKFSVVGGSAGGVDHMLMGMMLRATSANPDRATYLPTAAGADAIKALSNGQAQIGIAGYSEFKDAVQNGTLRALAISARRGEFGLPSLRDSGIDTVMVNWRGVFGAAGTTPEQREALAQLLAKLVASNEWKAAVKANQWQASYQAAEAFRQFIETEQTTARVVVHMLKLKG